jgi:uncharacterized protein (DUF2141 family)
LPNSASASESPPAPIALTLNMTGLRGAGGVIKIAICRADTGFPDCGKQAVLTTSINATGRAFTTTLALPPGQYAISAFHDRNANGKLDTMLGIPREGFAFSRNPPLRFRAARFDEAKFELSKPLELSLDFKHVL